jgi:hypothetical protein
MLSTAFCVALLAATAVAFGLTEGAKTELSPIYGTKVAKIFSPTCNLAVCQGHTASIVFWLRQRQDLQVWMAKDGGRVATLVLRKTFPSGEVKLAFNGRTLAGRLLPDGGYQPVIRLVDDHRTITLPNVIRLDTTPPKPLPPVHLVHTHISPDGDGRNDIFRVPYRLTGPGHAVLLVNGRQAVFTRSERLHGTITWTGRAGADKRPGHYSLALETQDAAGNRSAPVRLGTVTIRYLALGRSTIVARRLHRFAVFVLTDAQKFRWLFDRGHGVSRSHTLRVMAPRKRGTYTLYVTAAGHTRRATVVVR